MDEFLGAYKARKSLLVEDADLAKLFAQEMHRFLPAQLVKDNIEKNDLWQFIVYLIEDLERQFLNQSVQ